MGTLVKFWAPLVRQYIHHQSTLRQLFLVSIEHLYPVSSRFGEPVWHHRPRTAVFGNGGLGIVFLVAPVLPYVNEKEELLDLSQVTLQLIWGGKEALFKQFGGQIDDLKNEVSLRQIDQIGKKAVFSFRGDTYDFGFENLGTAWLVYSL